VLCWFHGGFVGPAPDLADYASKVAGSLASEQLGDPFDAAFAHLHGGSALERRCRRLRSGTTCAESRDEDNRQERCSHFKTSNNCDRAVPSGFIATAGRRAGTELRRSLSAPFSRLGVTIESASTKKKPAKTGLKMVGMTGFEPATP